MNLQNILDKWNIKCDINTILAMWNERHRAYHSITHLSNMIEQINESKSKYSEKEYEKLIITSIFHDVVYRPLRKDNEQKSADFFMKCCIDKENPDILEIKQIILDTKEQKPTTKLSEVFSKFDMSVVEGDFNHLVQWEDAVYREYSRVIDKGTYREGRIKYLESILDKYINNTDNLLKLIDYVKTTYNDEVY